MMQRSQDHLSRVFSQGLQDELWEAQGSSWQRRGIIRSALVMSAFESVQCFMRRSTADASMDSVYGVV